MSVFQKKMFYLRLPERVIFHFFAFSYFFSLVADQMVSYLITQFCRFSILEN